jgi:hypothetical protein
MRIFYILLSIILLTSFRAKSQDINLLPDSEPKIVKFYPNPATNFITFEVDKESSKTYNLQIFNFLGKKVLDLIDVSSKTIVNLSDFTRGIYIFQLKEANGKVTESGRFQVNK